MKTLNNLGPVVQNTTKLLAHVTLTILSLSKANTLIFLAKKMWVAFAVQKLLTFCSQNINVFENTIPTTVKKIFIKELVKLMMLWTTGPWTSDRPGPMSAPECWRKMDTTSGVRTLTRKYFIPSYSGPLLKEWICSLRVAPFLKRSKYNKYPLLRPLLVLPKSGLISGTVLILNVENSSKWGAFF